MSNFEIYNNNLYNFFQKNIPYLQWKYGDQKFKIFKKDENGWNIYLSEITGIVKKHIGFLTPAFYIKIYIFANSNESNKNSRYRIELFDKNFKKIATWHNGDDTKDCVYGGELSNLLSSFGVENFDLQQIKYVEKNFLNLKKFFINNKYVYNYIRLTKTKNAYENAQSVEIWLEFFGFADINNLNEQTKFSIIVAIKNLELESKKEYNLIDNINLNEANIKINDFVNKRINNNNFVDQSSSRYIPEDANSSNWDFDLNMPKNQVNKNSGIIKDLTYLDDIEIKEINDKNDKKAKSFLNFVKKIAQKYDFGGYYSGNIPDPSAYIGTSAVDAGQIKAVFSGADNAIQYVNEFNSSLLKNVAFIFNFSKAGAYGVYLTELDRAIKNEVLKKKLIQKGYKIIEENGVLTAYSEKPDIKQEQIDSDIKKLYDEIDRVGGTAIGINMNNVLNSAKADLNNIPNTEPDFLYEQLAILHLGETIVHEAIHAQGNYGEGPSEQGEATFATWVLPKINKKYLDHLKSVGKEQEFNEIIIGTQKRHANVKNWYKIAYQYSIPSNLFSPNGSDLSGRMGGWQGNLGGVQNWSMMFRNLNNQSIESLLGRQFMWPLAQDIDLDKDSIEQQLRKTFKNSFDTSKSTEELLEKDRARLEEFYKLTEEKLKDNRPAPLLQILKKASLNKIATLFGWYNNLAISDGSTIPGLGDRVMAWDDRDEDFAWTQEEIRKQPRYNPEYDIKGFYYRYIEPQFAPRLFDDMSRDYTNTHPAKRFGKNTLNENETKDLNFILDLISRVKHLILDKKIKAYRFILSEDLIAYIKDNLTDIKSIFVPLNNKNSEREKIYCLWLYEDNIDDKTIENCEKYFAGDKSFKMLANEILGIKDTNETLNSIIENLKTINAEENINDIYLVGEPAREKIYDEEITSNMFRFCCRDKSNAIIYGQILADKLNKKFDYDNNGDLKININDAVIIFHSGENKNVCKKLIDLGANPEDMNDGVKCELTNKDFTVNMIALNIVTNEIYDPFNVVNDIKNKTLKSFYDINKIIELNPIILLKILKMINDGYLINKEYYASILKNFYKLNKLDKNLIDLAKALLNKKGIINTGE